MTALSGHPEVSAMLTEGPQPHTSLRLRLKIRTLEHIEALKYNKT